MPTIKITYANGKTSTYLLMGYSLSPQEEGELLEIELPNNNFIKYLISTDRKEPNIYNIESFISNQFDNALFNGKSVYLEENITQGYICIGYGEQKKQFKAQKKK